jgi:hypothetical protein
MRSCVWHRKRYQRGRWRIRLSPARPGYTAPIGRAAPIRPIELAGHPAIEDRQRLRADVLAQPEELKEPKAKGLVMIRGGPVLEFIIPPVDQQLAFRQRQNGVLPLW